MQSRVPVGFAMKGHSLRKIGRRLQCEGYVPVNGGAWIVTVLAGVTASS